MSLFLDPGAVVAELEALGHAHGMLCKAAAAPESVYSLSGRLYASDSGWLFLDIPNAVVRGLFGALDEPGVELPLKDGVLTAHVSVMTDAELASIGGPQRVNERGKRFRYQLGPIQTVAPRTWQGVSKVWMVRILAPELQALRRSYGLPALPRGDQPFHCTFAVRRSGVLGTNAVAKGKTAP